MSLVNLKFAQALNEPAFAPREALDGCDARTLAREILAVTRVVQHGGPFDRHCRHEVAHADRPPPSGLER